MKIAAPVDGRSLRRKHSGTGKYDTLPATWADMRREYIAGQEPLTDVALRHGVIYSAAHERRRHEQWDELRPTPPAQIESNPPKSARAQKAEETRLAKRAQAQLSYFRARMPELEALRLAELSRVQKIALSLTEFERGAQHDLLEVLYKHLQNLVYADREIVSLRERMNEVLPDLPQEGHGAEVIPLFGSPAAG